jgi:hypothetical protein
MTLANRWDRSPVTVVWIREERFAAARHLMVARPLKAGIAMRTIDYVAERQLMCVHAQSTPQSFMRRSATQCLGIALSPGVETPGYHEISLREKRDLPQNAL